MHVACAHTRASSSYTPACAGASWGGFSTASYLAQGGDFFGKIVVQYVAYFLGLYFAIGVFLDLFLLGATAYSGVTYSTNAEAFLRYVKQVAGDKPGSLSVVEKAQSAVNTVKIITALNDISDILKVTPAFCMHCACRALTRG